MFKKFTTSIILIIMMSIPMSLFAQPSKGIVKGKVVDVETQAPL